MPRRHGPSELLARALEIGLKAGAPDGLPHLVVTRDRLLGLRLYREGLEPCLLRCTVTGEAGAEAGPRPEVWTAAIARGRSLVGAKPTTIKAPWPAKERDAELGGCYLEALGWVPAAAVEGFRWAFDRRVTQSTLYALFAVRGGHAKDLLIAPVRVTPTLLPLGLTNDEFVLDCAASSDGFLRAIRDAAFTALDTCRRRLSWPTRAVRLEVAVGLPAGAEVAGDSAGLAVALEVVGTLAGLRVASPVAATGRIDAGDSDPAVGPVGAEAIKLRYLDRIPNGRLLCPKDWSSLRERLVPVASLWEAVAAAFGEASVAAAAWRLHQGDAKVRRLRERYLDENRLCLDADGRVALRPTFEARGWGLVENQPAKAVVAALVDDERARCVVFTGLANRGKTTFLAQLAISPPEKVDVLVVAARRVASVPRRRELAGLLNAESGAVGEPLIAALAALGRAARWGGRKLVFAIDALNEVENPLDLVQWLLGATEALASEHLHFVVTTQAHAWDEALSKIPRTPQASLFLLAASRATRLTMALPLLGEGAVRDVLRRAGRTIPATIDDLLRYPGYLRMFVSEPLTGGDAARHPDIGRLLASLKARALRGAPLAAQLIDTLLGGDGAQSARARLWETTVPVSELLPGESPTRVTETVDHLVDVDLLCWTREVEQSHGQRRRGLRFEHGAVADFFLAHRHIERALREEQDATKSPWSRQPVRVARRLATMKMERETRRYVLAATDGALRDRFLQAMLTTDDPDWEITLVDLVSFGIDGGLIDRSCLDMAAQRTLGWLGRRRDRRWQVALTLAERFGLKHTMSCIVDRIDISGLRTPRRWLFGGPSRAMTMRILVGLTRLWEREPRVGVQVLLPLMQRIARRPLYRVHDVLTLAAMALPIISLWSGRGPVTEPARRFIGIWETSGLRERAATQGFWGRLLRTALGRALVGVIALVPEELASYGISVLREVQRHLPDHNEAVEPLRIWLQAKATGPVPSDAWEMVHELARHEGRIGLVLEPLSWRMAVIDEHGAQRLEALHRARASEGSLFGQGALTGLFMMAAAEPLVDPGERAHFATRIARLISADLRSRGSRWLLLRRRAWWLNWLGPIRVSRVHAGLAAYLLLRDVGEPTAAELLRGLVSDAANRREARNKWHDMALEPDIAGGLLTGLRTLGIAYGGPLAPAATRLASARLALLHTAELCARVELGWNERRSADKLMAHLLVLHPGLAAELDGTEWRGIDSEAFVKRARAATKPGALTAASLLSFGASRFAWSFYTADEFAPARLALHDALRSGDHPVMVAEKLFAAAVTNLEDLSKVCNRGV